MERMAKMGQYLNPDNYKFEEVKNAEIFVDKTGLISFLNKRIKTPQKYICSTRPRRFGKSTAIEMISAYYELENDSKELFEGCIIKNDKTFEKHLNKYDVINIDILVAIAKSKKKVKNKDYSVVDYITDVVTKELKNKYNEYIENDDTLDGVLSDINEKTKKQFVIVIDEWDAIFRLYKENKKLQQEYISFLRALFKGNAPDRFVALAYITGILPIKKYGTESALNNFMEHTMIEPSLMKEFIGFTEDEVIGLCDEYDMDFDDAKKWYDGYEFKWTKKDRKTKEIKEYSMHIYSPNSIVTAMMTEKYSSYWSETETFESLVLYISMNFEGLKDTIIRLMSGEKCSVNAYRYKNDLTSFASKDEVLAALIHLGYLAYDAVEKKTYIPNKEVMFAFDNAVEMAEWTGVVNAIHQSDNLLKATLKKDEEIVANILEKIHEENVSVLKYNDENSLSLVVTLAYYTAKNDYIVLRELQTGKGFADIGFLPKSSVDKPAIVVELKCNKTAKGAIQQIKDRNYCEQLKDYTGKILLVGINYNNDLKASDY